MTKVQLLVAPVSGRHYAAFARRVTTDILASVLAREPERVKLAITDRAPPRISLVPFARTPIALVSMWGGRQDHFRDLMRPDLRIFAYRVEESVPLTYDRAFSDGERTPGVGLLTTFRRKRGLDDETFMTRWHGVHTPLSLRIHPLWAYVRNVVKEPLDGAPPLDAIVEEQFRARRDLLQPSLMFGGRLAMWPNMVRVALDVAGFIDLSSLSTHLVSDLHVLG